VAKTAVMSIKITAQKVVIKIMLSSVMSPIYYLSAGCIKHNFTMIVVFFANVTVAFGLRIKF